MAYRFMGLWSFVLEEFGYIVAAYISSLVKEPMMYQPKEITSQEKQAKRMAGQKGFQLT